VRRFAHWLHRHLAVVSLVVVVAFFFVYQHQREDAAAQARADACHIIEVNDNGLISVVSRAPTPEKRAETQARLDAWAEYVNRESGVFHCDINLIPAP